jgi:hypothetical protein
MHDARCDDESESEEEQEQEGGTEGSENDDDDTASHHCARTVEKSMDLGLACKKIGTFCGTKSSSAMRFTKK